MYVVNICVKCPLLILDVNECDVSNGGCSDHCINNPGSYSCECRENADLDPDKRHCTCRPGFIRNDDTVTCNGKKGEVGAYTYGNNSMLFVLN